MHHSDLNQALFCRALYRFYSYHNRFLKINVDPRCHVLDRWPYDFYRVHSTAVYSSISYCFTGVPGISGSMCRFTRISLSCFFVLFMLPQFTVPFLFCLVIDAPQVLSTIVSGPSKALPASLANSIPAWGGMLLVSSAQPGPVAARGCDPLSLAAVIKVRLQLTV